MFDVKVDNQDHTLHFLRDGAVIGVITSEPVPLQGCISHPLGAMGYRAIASPVFYGQHFIHSLSAEAFARAPLIVGNRKDELQWRFIDRLTHTRPTPPIHYLPTTVRFVEAAR